LGILKADGESLRQPKNYLTEFDCVSTMKAIIIVETL